MYDNLREISFNVLSPYYVVVIVYTPQYTQFLHGYQLHRPFIHGHIVTDDHHIFSHIFATTCPIDMIFSQDMQNLIFFMVSALTHFFSKTHIRRFYTEGSICHIRRSYVEGSKSHIRRSYMEGSIRVWVCC